MYFDGLNMESQSSSAPEKLTVQQINLQNSVNNPSFIYFSFRYCDSNSLMTVDETEMGKNLGQIYLDISSSLEQDCPEGQTGKLIKAEKTCQHSFELIKDQDEIKLKKYSGEILNADNFCLTKYNGSGLFDRAASICMDDKETALKKADMKLK